MRHDIDLHLVGVERIAELEAKRGIQASYYVPLTLHFNPCYAPNAETIKRIVEMGHEVGLHYDLSVYDPATTNSDEWLATHVRMLESISDRSVQTICLHQPHKRAVDPFLQSDRFVNPHDPRFQTDVTYISDSCRAWRDETILRFLRPGPKGRLLLNTHPELWLGPAELSRLEFLDRVVKVNALRPHEDYFDHTVRNVWITHIAPRLHDQRDRKGHQASEGEICDSANS